MLEAHLMLCPTCQLQLGDLPPLGLPLVAAPGLLQACGPPLMPTVSCRSRWTRVGSVRGAVRRGISLW